MNKKFLSTINEKLEIDLCKKEKDRFKKKILKDSKLKKENVDWKILSPSEQNFYHLFQKNCIFIQVNSENDSFNVLTSWSRFFSTLNEGTKKELIVKYF